jgi:PKD repeat protein
MFTIQGLAGGAYCVTITDGAGCVSTACATVQQLTSPLSLVTTHVCAPTCANNNGEFGITVIGGSAPYQFTWSGNGATGSGTSTMDTVKIMGLSAGTYSITITSAGGCSATITATMSQPTEMVVAAVPTCATVCGGNDGKITVGVLFGMGNYTYNWANSTDNTSGTGTGTSNQFVIPGLTEGAYSITITGSDGCTAVAATVVTPISSLNLNATATGVSCDGTTQGSITVNVGSGSGNYTYTWANGASTGTGSANAGTFTIGGLASGAYTITVTDAANGCTGTATVGVGGNLGGNVFNDFNADCTFGSEEFGLDSVLIYLYECENPIPVDSVWTNAAGNFVFPSLSNYPYRLEFVVVKDSCCLKPSLACGGVGSTVQFISQANCNIQVGFLNPANYCQDNPEIAFSCFAQGKTDEVTAPVVALVPYDATDRSQLYGDVAANNELIGSVYGLAYDRSNKYLYASAFLKRHVGLGELGLGGIYRIDYHNGTENPNVTGLYTVPNVGDVIRPADLSASNIPSMDTDAFGKVGKMGLGDLDIMGDNTLWTINLFNRTLVRVDGIQTASPSSVEIPIASAPTCTNGVFRPLGIKIDCEKIYVGGVCTGEGPNGTSADLSASIHVFDTKDSTWMMVLSWDLSLPEYNHGDIVGSVNQNLAQCREWETWTDVYTERNLVANTGAGEPSQIFSGNFEIVGGGPTGAEFRCRGQAMVSDIEITREGVMVIAMMDRTGHQFGYRQFRPTTNTGNPISATAGGDALAAYRVNNVWTLENNGTIPGINRTSQFGPNSNDGPGGGEFFYDNTRYHHLDAEAGGLLYVPGRDELLGAINNPNTSEYNFGGGVVYYDLLTGSATRNDLTLLDPVNNSVGIGMANTIGDLEAMCDEAPIQIGNYVWSDQNEDGVQDACENPIPGVLVSLYDGETGALLASTVTGQNGEYYFTGLGHVNEAWIATDGRDSVMAFHPYYIVFGKNANLTQFNVTTSKLTVNGIKYELTVANTGAGWHKDWNDSDAQIANAPSKAWDKYPTIWLTTGMAGCSDHTYDAGFVSEVPDALVACAMEPGGNTAQFNLPEANDIVDPAGTALAVTYYATQANAQSGNAALSSPYTAEDNTIIYAQVQQANGSTAIVSVRLQVEDLPVAHAAQLQDCPTAFDGPTASFDLAGADVQVTGGAPGLVVTYHETQVNAEQGTNAIVSAYTSNTKSVWARVENANGCYDLALVQLQVLNSPGLVLAATDNTCTGAGLGSIAATVFDGPSDYSFAWSNGTVQNDVTGTSTTLANLNAGVYTVTLTDGNGCTATASTAIVDAVPFAIIPIPDYNVNAGAPLGPIVLQTTTWGADFTWTGGATVGLNDGTATSLLPLIPTFTVGEGAATVVVTATMGACSNTVIFDINAQDLQAPTALCENITVVLGPNGTTSITPQQLDGGSTDSYAATNTLTLTASNLTFGLTNLGNNSVTLTVTDPSGNSASCVAQVLVSMAQTNAPMAVFSMNQLQSCMAPFAVKFNDLSLGTPTAWQWTFEGGVPATSTEQSPTVMFATAGNHLVTLQVTNSAGTDTYAFQASVQNNYPVADFDYIMRGLGTVEFDNLSQLATTYAWKFGDGTESTLANPIHAYANVGTYIVELTAGNGCGSQVVQQEVNITSTGGVGGPGGVNTGGTSTGATNGNPNGNLQGNGNNGVSNGNAFANDANIAEEHSNKWLESFRLSPNPNVGNFTVEMAGKAQDEVEFLLLDALGQLVKRDKSHFDGGYLKQVFDYRDLPAGVYTLSIRSGEQTVSEKVVIQR